MSSVAHGGHVDHRRPRLPTSMIWLAILISVDFVGAVDVGCEVVAGSVGRIRELGEAPAGGLFWPGVFLLVTAGMSVLALVGILFGWRWRWAHRIESALGFRWPWLVSAAIGVTLAITAAVGLHHPVFDPLVRAVLLAGGVATSAVAAGSSARAHLRVTDLRSVGRRGGAATP